jgi:hypothetical protein
MLGVAFVVAGCGPSFQAIYEGDARFEHCYALDDDPNVAMQRKSDCWKEWTAHFTYGQTRDRVEYAAMRYRALSRVPGAPTDEAMMSAAPGEQRGATLSAPAPTNAFAPPPTTQEGDAAASPAPSVPANVPVSAVPPPAATVSPAPTPPRSDCVDTCGGTWQKCKGSCTASTCGACDKTYGRCVKGCF